jgi:hypothetical protein
MLTIGPDVHGLKPATVNGFLRAEKSMKPHPLLSTSCDIRLTYLFTASVHLGLFLN